MKISFSPIRQDTDIRLERQGEVLLINGEAFDFGALPEGAELPVSAIASPWFAGPVRRCGGCLHLHVVLPHGADADAKWLFPDAVSQDCDGLVPLPPVAPLTHSEAKT